MFNLRERKEFYASLEIKTERDAWLAIAECGSMTDHFVYLCHQIDDLYDSHNNYILSASMKRRYMDALNSCNEKGMSNIPLSWFNCNNNAADHNEVRILCALWFALECEEEETKTKRRKREMEKLITAIKGGAFSSDAGLGKTVIQDVRESIVNLTPENIFGKTFVTTDE